MNWKEARGLVLEALEKARRERQEANLNDPDQELNLTLEDLDRFWDECSHCQGRGWVSEHNPSCWNGRECEVLCPIQIQCPACFYEDDEPIDKILAAYYDGWHGTTRPPDANRKNV